jgi:hypothetical protein
MYKILEKNVMLRIEDKWINTKAVLASCSGGKRIDWVAKDGTIIKSVAYSRSKYSKDTK